MNAYLQHIDRIPENLKHLYKTAFEVDIFALIAATARRQKWIDMGVSFNLYIAQPSGKLLNDMYMACWKKGLKTTYYLRALSATTTEKSTINTGSLNAVSSGSTASSTAAASAHKRLPCQKLAHWMSQTATPANKTPWVTVRVSAVTHHIF